jgi:putative membrane protein
MAVITRRTMRRIRRNLPLSYFREADAGSPLKGLAAGLAGGLVASWVMNQFQAAWSRLSREFKPPAEPRPQRVLQPAGAAEAANGGRMAQFEQQVEQEKQASEEQENPTVKVAETVIGAITGRPLATEQKPIAGPIVHYAYGTLIGGAYGMLGESYPMTRAGFGTVYGTGAWLMGDEVMLPLLGLTKWPQEYPLSVHAYALVSHWVYGAALEGIRRGLRRLM